MSRYIESKTITINGRIIWEENNKVYKGLKERIIIWLYLKQEKKHNFLLKNKS